MTLTKIQTQAGGVQVWRADLDRPPVGVDALTWTLSPDERARAGRFHQEHDRDRFIAARGLLRVLLGDALGCPPPALRFHYNAFGKPALERAGARLGFNLSHSGGVALFALSWGREVGVDIERVRPDIDSISLAKRYLPAGDAALLLALPPTLRPDAFTRAWVRHEASLKALGVGFTSAAMPPAAGRWVHHDLEVGAGYRGALVVTRESQPLPGG